MVGIKIIAAVSGEPNFWASILKAKSGKGFCFLVIFCSFLAQIALGQDVSFSGNYTLTFYDLSSGKSNRQYQSKFSFARKGNDWELEVRDNPFTPGVERLKWIEWKGLMYQATFTSTRGSNVIQKVMDVTTNSLPDWGWHCAIPLLLVFDPPQVLESNSPSIPSITFLPVVDGQPNRPIWCQVDGGDAQHSFVNLRAYWDRSASAPIVLPPGRPSDPLLAFECRIAKFVEIGDHAVPTDFYFRATYPHGGASPEDVITSWDVRGRIDQDSVKTEVAPLLELEGKTLLVDTRVQLADGSYASYFTTNSILETNSPAIMAMAHDRAMAVAERLSAHSKSRIIIAAMVLSTLVLLPLLTKLIKNDKQKTSP
jgi:hypothetical protein